MKQETETDQQKPKAGSLLKFKFYIWASVVDTTE